MRRAALIVVATTLSCRSSSQTQTLYPAGSAHDEGHGLLAHASSSLITNPEETPATLEDVARHRGAVGGNSYGGNAYGGATYATYVVPAWTYPSVNRTPTYDQQPGLGAALEGTITWSGSTPTLTTACGSVQPVRTNARRALAGVLVYIDRVDVGRVLPHGNGEQRPATVGGVVVKRGCTLAPTVQIVTPVPAALAIHGDAKPTRLRITTPGGTLGPAELQEGGRITLQATQGVTRIESADGSIGAAWVLGLDTPAYAITDDEGRFRIDELAHGTYQVSIWQPPIPTLSNGALVYGEPRIVTRRVTITGKLSQLDVTLGR